MQSPIKRKPSGRGRPEMSLEQRQQMRLRISTVAKLLFRQEGYAKVSMRKIAKEIGCTPMTLYGYYAGKIDVLKSLWGGVFEEVFGELKALPFDPDAAHYLRALSLAYVDYWIRHPDYYRLVFMAEGVTQPDVSLFVDNPEIVAHYSIFLLSLQKLYSDRTEADVKQAFDFMLSTLHGIAHNRITISGYEWSSPESQIEFIVRAFLADA